jgi:hypothetical protein
MGDWKFRYKRLGQSWTSILKGDDMKIIEIMRTIIQYRFALFIAFFILLSFGFVYSTNIEDEIVSLTKSTLDSTVRFMICGNMPIDNVSISEIRSLFASDNFQSRACAALILQKGKGVDSTIAITILLSNLDIEIEKPLSNEIVHPYAYPITECLKLDYVEAVSALCKNDSKTIHELADTLKGELQYRLILKMSSLGDSISRIQAREILESSGDNYLRLLAAKSMNNSPDKGDIPILLKHLNDDFYITDEIGQNRYEIRTEAACALMKQGYVIERVAPEYQENVIIKEPEK